MPLFHRYKKQLPGKVIEARTLREMAQQCDDIAQMHAEPPLTLTGGIGGFFLRYAGPIFGAYVAVADGAITARSGSTPGTGNATLQTWNGTALASLGVDLPVLNWNSATGGILTGKYMVIMRIYGVYWVIAAEC